MSMEEGLEKAQGAFAALDAQMSHNSQTAAKIGNRLHVRRPPPSPGLSQDCHEDLASSQVSCRK